MILACVFGFGLYHGGLLTGSGGIGNRSEPQTLFVSADDVPGAFFPVPPELSKGTQRVLGLIKMPGPEKERLSLALETGDVRIAAIWLWDNQAEDGDSVRISASGFTQTTGIKKSPTMFYVPVQTGTSMQITAVADGGGGVTLGVRTILGPFPLPPLVVGQSLEIPVL